MIVPEPDRVHIRQAAADRGLDLEEIHEISRDGTWCVTVVVDGDSGVSLDAITELTGVLDPLAETWGDPDQAVTLEVSSRGVDAPLVQRKHWRRARGRLVDFSYVAGATGPSLGRVGDLDEDTGTVLVVSRTGRALQVDSVALEQVNRAVIRVEFRPAAADELALLSGPADTGRAAREGEDG